MKKKLFLILGVLVCFLMIVTNVYADEQIVVITEAKEGDEETFLEYSDDMYKLHEGTSYMLFHQIQNREDGYCFYATSNTGNVYYDFIDCSATISEGHFDGNFDGNSLTNHEYTFGFVTEENVIEANCPQMPDYSDENKKYNLNGCGDLNVVNTSTYTVQNPYNRQNEISIKSVILDEKIYDSNTEGSATVIFEGKYYKDNLVKGVDYVAVANYSTSEVTDENVDVYVTVNLIGDAANRYRLYSTFYATTGRMLPYQIQESDIIVNNDDTISIVVNEIHLVENVNYIVEYSENNKVITATITGIGNYAATPVTKTYNKTAFDGDAFVQELVDEVLEDEIIINTLGNDNSWYTSNSLNYRSLIYNILSNRVEEDNNQNWLSMQYCTKTKCVVDFYRYSSKDGSTYGKTGVEVPYRAIGIIGDDILDASVGDTLSVNYKYVDVEGHEAAVELKSLYPSGQSEEYATITNDNKIKVLKKGIFSVYANFKYNDETYSRTIYVFADVDDVISDLLDESSTLYANKSRYTNYPTLSMAERTLVDDVIGDTWLDYYILSDSTCNSEECVEDVVANINFTFVIGEKSYAVQKNNVTIIPFGIDFEEYYSSYEPLDLTIGTPYQLEYELYSTSAVWTSSNPEVATVNNSGLITPVGEGVTIVSAMVEKGYFESAVVRVKPTVGTFKSNLTATLTELLDGRTTFDAKAISTLDENFLSLYLEDRLYEEFGRDFEDENIEPIFRLSDDLTALYMSLGYYYYDLKLPNGDTEQVAYCGNINWGADAFNCSTDEVELTIVYEDQKPGFDNALITKAQELLARINFEEKHYSFINKSLREQIALLGNDEVEYNPFIKYSDYNEIISNEDGYTFNLAGRMGSITSAVGNGFIVKDGVVYAATEDLVSLTEAIGVPGEPKTDAEKLEAIRNVINDKVDTTKYNVEIEKRDDEELEEEENEFYSISIVDKNDEDNSLYFFAALITNYEESSVIIPEEPIEVTHDNIENQSYTGSAVTPTVNVYGDGTLLMLGVDYSVRYENNVNVGTAKVYVTSLNNRFETFSIDFQIVASNETSTVSFDTDGGSIIASQEVNRGNKAQRPNDPTKGDLVFDNWYTDKTYRTLFDFNQPINRDTTVYARWITIINEVNITGIVEPVEGNKPDVSNLEITTEGIGIKEAHWYLDKENWDQTGPAKAFVAGEKYMLLIIFDIHEGYRLSEEFNEDNLTVNLPFAKGEVVGEGTEADARLYYGVVELPRINNAPVVNISKSNDNALLLDWELVENASSYEVQRSTKATSGFTKIATVTDSSYLNTGLTYGTTYYYKVKAVNSVSNKVSTVVSKKVLPNKVKLNITSASTNNVLLGWEKVNVSGYEVYSSTDNKKWTKATTITKNSTLTYNKTKLSANKVYYFKVRAYKTVGRTKVYGDYSDVVSTKTAPVKPTLSLSIKEYNSHNLTIGASTGATKYVVEKSLDGKEYSLVVELAEKGTLIQDGEMGKTYYYRVRTCNSENRCSGWATASIKQNMKAPVIKVTNANNNTILISDYQTEGASSYVIYRGTSKTGKYTEIGKTTDTSFVSTGLTYGKTYYYKVKAMNDVCSVTSGVVSGKTIPNKVEKVVIKSVGTNNIVTAWDKVNVNGYEVYSSTDNKKWSKATTITKNSTLTYNKTKLSANKVYYFKVRAYKTVSRKKVYGPWSEVVSTRTAPVKPTLSLSIKEYNEHNVNIGESKGASKYVVERSLDGKEYSLVEELPGKGVLSQSGELGTTYYYRVRTCNIEDNCSAWVTASIKQTTKIPSLSLSTSSKKVTITVTKVDKADGYEIYRSTKKAGKYTKVATLTSEEEILEYVNKTSKGTTYYYKVRAYSQIDETTKVYSSYSSAKSIRSK